MRCTALKIKICLVCQKIEVSAFLLVLLISLPCYLTLSQNSFVKMLGLYFLTVVQD